MGHHESLGACLTVGIIRIERVGVFEHPLAIVIVRRAVLTTDFADESSTTCLFHVVVAEKEMHFDALVLDIYADERMNTHNITVHTTHMVCHVVEIASRNNQSLCLAVGHDFRLLIAECFGEPIVEQFVELFGILASALNHTGETEAIVLVEFDELRQVLCLFHPVVTIFLNRELFHFLGLEHLCVCLKNGEGENKQ